VVGGLGGKIVEGRDLLRVVIDARSDPRTLARVALWVALREGEILETPQNDEQRKAKVVPPAVAQDVLVFWVWTSGVGRMLQQAKLDLSTGAFELAAPPVARDDAIASASTALAGTSISMQTAAIRTLGEACSDPKAKQALLDALANHPRDETRSAAADAAPRCGAGAVGALIHTLEHDKAPLVRGQAANALGAIGEARARPALEKAARSDDANLAWAANHALKQLK
jgi:HEAT repeat protein